MTSNFATANDNPAPAQNISAPVLVNCVAYQDGAKLADIAHRSDQRLSAAARLLRLGRAARRRSRQISR